MGESKHTPWPWLLDGTTVYALNEQGTNRTCFNVSNGGDIWRSYDRASYDHTPTPREEHEANARLIAAAPDLHRELRGARCPRPCNHRPDDFEVGQCVDAGECGCSLGAAIAKAEGTPTPNSTTLLSAVSAEGE